MGRDNSRKQAPGHWVLEDLQEGHLGIEIIFFIPMSKLGKTCQKISLDFSFGYAYNISSQ